MVTIDDIIAMMDTCEVIRPAHQAEEEVEEVSAHADIFALAKHHGAAPNVLMSTGETLNWLAEVGHYKIRWANDNAGDWKLFRKTLREELLVDKLISPDQALTFSAEFDGSGDSGDVHTSTGNQAIDFFLEKMVDKHVHFDWYNNDGGGGDITWDVRDDRVTINGYQNETTTSSMMEEEEF
jgi:hypothetical protein